MLESCSDLLLKDRIIMIVSVAERDILMGRRSEGSKCSKRLKMLGRL